MQRASDSSLSLPHSQSSCAMCKVHYKAGHRWINGGCFYQSQAQSGTAILPSRIYNVWGLYPKPMPSSKYALACRRLVSAPAGQARGRRYRATCPASKFCACSKRWAACMARQGLAFLRQWGCTVHIQTRLETRDAHTLGAAAARQLHRIQNLEPHMGFSADHRILAMFPVCTASDLLGPRTRRN